MKSHPRIRKTTKWAAAALTILAVSATIGGCRQGRPDAFATEPPVSAPESAAEKFTGPPEVVIVISNLRAEKSPNQGEACWWYHSLEITNTLDVPVFIDLRDLASQLRQVEYSDSSGTAWRLSKLPAPCVLGPPPPEWGHKFDPGRTERMDMPAWALSELTTFDLLRNPKSGEPRVLPDHLSYVYQDAISARVGPDGERRRVRIGGTGTTTVHALQHGPK